jgi:hypothetical protein
MAEVWIPDTPAVRSYTCPSCKKGVKTFRVGNTSSYWVMDADDEKKEHDCKYKGPISSKLLGYRPIKKEEEIKL